MGWIMLVAFLFTPSMLHLALNRFCLGDWWPVFDIFVFSFRWTNDMGGAGGSLMPGPRVPALVLPSLCARRLAATFWLGGLRPSGSTKAFRCFFVTVFWWGGDSGVFRRF